jgi:uncharacterized membrane protein YphA (DoxX/SURF4 family)
MNALLRWLIAGAFVWAALGKLANPHEFYGAIRAYQLPLPAILTRTAAVVLPWLELLCGLLLAANLRRGAALIWALVLFAVFTIVTGQAWLRGLPIACGCFDLQLLGIPRGSGLARLLESVAFASVRALFLAAAAAYLLRHEFAEARHRDGP